MLSGLSLPHIILLLVIVVLIFGTGKLRNAGKDLGGFVKGFKEGMRDDEKPRLVADMGDRKALILRNHGLLTVGRNVAEAWLTMYFLESACKIQIDAQRGGELTMVDPKILEGMEQTMKVASAGQGPGIAWPALLRKLDREDASYKT